jgi:Xaa-Pro aminopeptidase
MKDGLPGVLSQSDWILTQLNASGGGKVGLDPRLYSISPWEALQKKLESANHQLVPVERNPVDEVWGAARPPRPAGALRVLDTVHTGVTWPEKVRLMCDRLNASDVRAEALLLSALDEIAWVLNLRGNDISFNPVFFAYAILKQAALSPQNKCGTSIDFLY